jgi:hypothetical protein
MWGFLYDFRYPQDGSYPFLIYLASQTGDHVLELLLINIESNYLIEPDHKAIDL